MSAFYDLASLVLVPSGYKASKVYAQKPLTTDGQLTFSRASTATRVNSAGLIETVSSNVPRLDYQGSTCPKLLLEPQRTNLYRYSQEYDNAAWTKVNMNITANAANGPFGTLTAENAVPSTTSGGHYVAQSIAVTAGTTYTVSVYAKANGYDWIYLFADGAGSGQYRLFNVTNGTLGLAAGTATPTITAVGGGWYRCAMTWTPSVTGNLTFQTAVLSSNSVNAFAGDGTSGVLLYQSQLEAGAYPTSIIPTTSAAVTRLADACGKTGISSLFGSAFSLFIDVVKLQDPGPTRYLVAKGTGSTYQNWIAFEKVSEGVSFFVNDNTGTSVVGINKANLNVGQRLKIAARCQNGSYAFYVNGELIGTSTAAFTPSVSTLDLHYFDYIGNQTYNQVMILSPLTNAQLAELTAL